VYWNIVALWKHLMYLAVTLHPWSRDKSWIRIWMCRAGCWMIIDVLTLHLNWEGSIGELLTWRATNYRNCTKMPPEHGQCPKVVDSTLVEWSQSLPNSEACSLGHAKSISYKKTHCHRTQFEMNRIALYRVLMEKRIFWFIYFFRFTVCLSDSNFLQNLGPFQRGKWLEKVKWGCHRLNNNN